MREALNAGNVAVYTIDTMGSRRRSIASGSLNDSLSHISNETGGHYYANFTNILSPMRQVAEENQGYYLVSFRSEYEAGTQGLPRHQGQGPRRQVQGTLPHRLPLRPVDRPVATLHTGCAGALAGPLKIARGVSLAP